MKPIKNMLSDVGKHLAIRTNRTDVKAFTDKTEESVKLRLMQVSQPPSSILGKPVAGEIVGEVVKLLSPKDGLALNVALNGAFGSRMEIDPKAAPSQSVWAGEAMRHPAVQIQDRRNDKQSAAKAAWESYGLIPSDKEIKKTEKEKLKQKKVERKENARSSGGFYITMEGELDDMISERKKSIFRTNILMGVESFPGHDLKTANTILDDVAALGHGPERNQAISILINDHWPLLKQDQRLKVVQMAIPTAKEQPYNTRKFIRQSCEVSTNQLKPLDNHLLLRAMMSVDKENLVDLDDSSVLHSSVMNIVLENPETKIALENASLKEETTLGDLIDVEGQVGNLPDNIKNLDTRLRDPALLCTIRRKDQVTLPFMAFPLLSPVQVSDHAKRFTEEDEILIAGRQRFTMTNSTLI